jgi:hypothetical protein
MGLEHQQAGKSAHPVDIGEAGFGSVGRGHARFARAVYGSRQPKTQEVYPEVQAKIPLSSLNYRVFWPDWQLTLSGKAGFFAIVISLSGSHDDTTFTSDT